MNHFNWIIKKKSSSSRARNGLLITPHGTVDSPAFIFCGTKGSLKSLLVKEAVNAGTQVILSNTYHLMLQPGGDIISQHGGLHKFMNWKGPMLTDSGGFQIFSLGHGSVADEMLSGFSRKLGDDLNISGALGELFTWVNDMFSRLDSDEINYDIAQQALSALGKVDEVLGVMEADQVETDDKIQGLIDRRNQARAEKDWDTADVIRKQLDELGIVLEDTSEGTIWKKK